MLFHRPHQTVIPQELHRRVQDPAKSVLCIKLNGGFGLTFTKIVVSLRSRSESVAQPQLTLVITVKALPVPRRWHAETLYHYLVGNLLAPALNDIVQRPKSNQIDKDKQFYPGFEG